MEHIDGRKVLAGSGFDEDLVDDPRALAHGLLDLEIKVNIRKFHDLNAAEVISQSVVVRRGVAWHGGTFSWVYPKNIRQPRPFASGQTARRLIAE